MNHARMMLMASLAVILLGVAGWCFSRLMDSRHRAMAAAQETRKCIRLAEAIELSRRAQASTGEDPFQSQPLQQLIQKVANKVGIDPDRAIRSIRPQPGRRLAKSSYIEHSAELKLQNVSRRQLVEFMHAMMQKNSGLQVRSLRLTSTGNSQHHEDRWNADPLTLTYLIDEPSSPESVAGHASQR